MLSSDRPISSISEDFLGRGAFSKRMASAISEIKIGDSIAIGLHGPWGSGKTSVINMTIEELKASAPDIPIVRFNPWGRIESSDLVTEFFSTLKDEIAKQCPSMKYNGEATSAICDAVSEYSDALGKGVKKIVIKRFTKKWSKKAEAKLNSIETRKEKVSGLLKQYDMKILVVIDDIDRLSSIQIRSLFQLVASIADFPCVSYLLSYDKAIVDKALECIQNCDGSEYLEKIIQVPIRVPEIDANQVARQLSSELSSLLSLYTTQGDFAAVVERGDVLRSCVYPHIRTVRNMKRYMNVLRFELAGSNDKVSPLDIAAIASIQLFLPELIPWIVSHKGILCGETRGGYSHKEAQEYRSRYTEILSKYFHGDGAKAARAIASLSALFPLFGENTGSAALKITNETLRMEKRLAHSEVFDAYFAGRLETYAFPQSLIVNMAFDFSEDEFERILSRSFKSENFGVILEGLIGLKDRIDESRAPIICRPLLAQIGKTSGIGQFLSENSRVTDLLNSMLKTIGLEKASPLVEDAISKLDLDGIIAIAPFISEQERAYDRYELKGGSSYEKLIDASTLERIEGKFVSAMKEGMDGLLVLSKDGIRIPMYLWEKFDAKSYQECFLEALRLPMGKALIAQLFTSQWHGGRTYGWTVDDSFKVYVSEEEVLSDISETVRKKEFWELPKSLIERISAFYIGIEKKAYGLGEDRIDKMATEKRIAEWKKLA